MAPAADSQRLLARSVTVAVILLGGLALYLARSALGPRLDALPDLARLTAAEEPPPPEEAPVEVAAEPEPEEPSGPLLTYEQIEQMLAPLPDRALQLIADGRGELPEFEDMKSERGRRFFASWGNTWNNRLDQLGKDTPPWEECEIHAPLVDACSMLREVSTILRTVPSITEVDEGKAILDRAEQVVEDFLNPPEEEEEEDPEAAPDESAG